MSNTFSTLGLHLRYRLWIADLNADTIVLRIFEDYITELESKQDSPEIKNTIPGFREQFINSRKETDELKHEMHLVKMKLAALSKTGGGQEYDSSILGDHKILEKNYTGFRETFDTVKKEFVQFADTLFK